MPRRASGANAKRSKKRACVEHMFGRQKGPMDFSIRSVGPARAEARIATVNICYNMRRAVFLGRRMAAGRVCPEFGNSPPIGQEQGLGGPKIGPKDVNL